MSSLGINLAIFLRGVVCRGGGGCGGREGGGIVIFCTNYRVGTSTDWLTDLTVR